ncbi:hypothetical protein MUN89_02610 [Halobacillus salinarum]|uniref:DUF4871 domain-containing protein n=1 Tax=Halobacillus salinarum TaxID=2932257 RepID=A0ABY4EKA6_9BACI|nr:hypothetical protein [Halobacillus salinarum]UOQ44865.1 hypothetical protein MUN89_02610 [Halobacillus salinarum]
MKKSLRFSACLTLFIVLLAACEADRQPADETSTDGTEASVEAEEQDKEWDLSPTFTYKTKSDGEPAAYEVTGNKNGFGITGPFPIVSSKPNKYFWLYWGGENLKDRPVKITGHKKGSKEEVQIFTGEFTKSVQLNENEANMPSNLKFPSSGIWKLSVLVDGEAQGNIVVEVVSK